MAKRKTAETGEEGQDGAVNPLHPRLATRLYGHEAAEELFLSAFRAGALHHAWLLTGEEGIGKATFAYRAARFLLSRDSGGGLFADEPASLDIPASHPVARQIAAGAHPSLFALDAGGAASIGVEAVRKLRAFLGLTSPGGGWRAMIVDPTNDLTISSANALLKAVEEPPPRTVFFLVSHGASAVMPTIRSRCVKLAFRALDPEAFASAVSAACLAGDLTEPGEADMQKLFALSSGSPGRALDFLAGGLALSGKVERIVGGLPKLDHAAVHELVQAASGARNAETFERLCDLIEEEIAAKARKQAQAGPDGTAEAAAWAELWQRYRERRLELESLNLDKGAFLIAAFADMQRAYVCVLRGGAR
jgi:DNA polymerase III subunit delta'